ncbi:phosphoribosyl-AMP cyclohydrolase [Desulfosoma caldarium]|uniref:phosphoribosyl-AMP cyclohydrolase n=1 Tax=Desulfosoma caldarium TaxID=610254 RepID=UPI000F4AF456|nr:phosphoribosyl-AMP cyclohydrolase [Desulfosoma caldarium]
MTLTEKPDFAKGNGLIPVIVQDVTSRRVLMLAYMNETAWTRTVETGLAHYWSRSRNALWLKGETSGHVQKVHAMYVDCDADTLLIVVEQSGAACHEGYASCFFRRFENGAFQVAEERVFDPKEVYKA